MTDETQRILVVEDDPSLAMGLVDALEFEGFRVTHSKSGGRGAELAREDRPDCIILDLMLPDLNGYRVCEEIRKTDPAVPILILTARSQEADKIRGLEAGADDYVTKPFSIGELVARIRALLRRSVQAGPGSRTAPFLVGPWRVDPARQVLEDGRREHSLSFHEVQLLQLLYEHRGEVVSRESILERIWGLEGKTNNRTVDNFVVKLRKKVEAQPDKPQHIRTVYGVGYKLVS